MKNALLISFCQFLSSFNGINVLMDFFLFLLFNMSVLVLNCQIKRLKLKTERFLLSIDLKIFTINRLIIYYIKCLIIVEKVFNFLLLSDQQSKNSKSFDSLSELRNKGSKSSHSRSWRRTVFEILVWKTTHQSVFLVLGVYVWTKRVSTWQESVPPSRYPAQIIQLEM